MRRCAWFEVKPVEAREPVRPHIERAHRVDPDPPLAVRPGLEDGHHARIDLGDIHQEIAIARPGEALFLLLRGEAGHVVDLGFVKPRDVGAYRGRERRVGQQLRPRLGVDANHQLVGAESLAIEEDAASEPDRAVEIVSGTGGVEPYRIDAELAQEPRRNDAVGSPAVDLQCPAVYQLYPAAQLELVALGVPAEIVVIVEDENARRRLALAIEISG